MPWKRKEFLDRPPCPLCESRHINKNGGVQYLCTDCGKRFSRFTNHPKKKKDYSMNPSCPICSAHRGMSDRDGYRCLECGKWYKSLEKFNEDTKAVLSKGSRTNLGR